MYRSFDSAFERFRYPAGESHLRLRQIAEVAKLEVIEARATSFDDLAQIVTADRVLRRNGARVRWFVPYFPFARHDRRNDTFDGFELKLALELVCEIDIVIADPHSDVAGQLCNISQSCAVERFREAGAFDSNPLIVVPDAGAGKKVHSWSKGMETVQALKHRDPETGELSGFKILADDLGGRPCIMVDDICDGGGTFLGLAEQLGEHNAGPLSLAVTHGVFSKGTDVLLGAFDKIFTFRYADAEARTYEGGTKKMRIVEIPFRELYEKGAQV